MNVRLILNRNRKCVWSARLSQTEATLGRARGCTVRIPSSEVSRQHCRLRIDDDVVTVEDLESANGTFINGNRIRDIELLQSGDRLTLGPVTFVVKYEIPANARHNLDQNDEHPVVEAESAIDVVEETTAQPGKSSIPMVEPAEEQGYSMQKVDAIDEVADEVSILDDPSSEIHLPESGDDFRDFLIELDDSDERPGLH